MNDMLYFLYDRLNLAQINLEDLEITQERKLEVDYNEGWSNEYTFELTKDEESNTLAIRDIDNLQILDTNQPEESKLHLETIKSFTVGKEYNQHTLMM